MEPELGVGDLALSPSLRSFSSVESESRGAAIADLQSRLAMSEAKLEQAGQFGLGLLHKTQAAEQASAELTTEVAAHKAATAAALKQVDQLERKLEAKIAKNRSINAELDDAQQALDEAHAAAKQLEASQRSQLRKVQDQASDRDDSWVRQTEEAAATNAALLTAQTEIRNLRTEHRKTADECKAIEEFNEQLQTSVHTAERRAQVLEGRLTEARQQVKSECERAEAGNEREMDMARDRARLMSTNESLLRELERLDEAAREADSFNDSFRESFTLGSPMTTGVTPMNLLQELQGEVGAVERQSSSEELSQSITRLSSGKHSLLAAALAAEEGGANAEEPTATPAERSASRAIDAAREFFYMSVQTVIIARTNPSKMAIQEQEKEQLEQLESSFRTAAALAEASGAYGEPHLYGLYKQATEGLCKTARPGVWSYTARRKWHAWDVLKDMAQDVAKRHYVDLVAELSSSWGIPIEVADEHANSNDASFYYLTHHTIDEMYKYARKVGVPMQDWHSWIEKQLDYAVGKYLEMDGLQREWVRGKVEPSRYVEKMDGLQRGVSDSADSATVIAAFVSGKLADEDLSCLQ